MRPLGRFSLRVLRPQLLHCFSCVSLSFNMICYFTQLLICGLLHQNGLLGISGRLGIEGVGFPGGGGAGLPNTGRLKEKYIKLVTSSYVIRGETSKGVYSYSVLVFFFWRMWTSKPVTNVQMRKHALSTFVVNPLIHIHQKEETTALIRTLELRGSMTRQDDWG